MRKVAGAAFAAALALTLGPIATPAGADGGTTCKSLTGSASFSPALPKLSSNTKVKPTITIKGAKVGGCKGGNVTTGTLAANLKFGVASNCTTLSQGANTNTKGSATIVWNTKQSSTSAVSLKVVSGNPTAQTWSGSVAAGLFKGSKFTVTTMLVVPSGVCTATGLSKVPFKAVTVLKIE
jgi:transcription initiation factor TFIID subunit TAF12